MNRVTDLAVDLKMSCRSLAQVIEQIDDVLDPAIGVVPPTRSDLIRMLTLMSSDLGLVQRTIEGVARRVR